MGKLESCDDVILAKDINDCSNCPLYQYDCTGGWTSGGGGSPIEPPCCSWNEDDKVYEGMYKNNTYEPSEQEMKWARETMERKEQEQKEKQDIKHKEEAQKRIDSTTRYGNAKIRSNGEWYCPKCKRWFHEHYMSSSMGIVETMCYSCGEILAHSSLLD